MSWAVRVQDVNGKPLIPEDLDVEFSVLDNLAPEWVMLRCIDPYGDTTFNRIQVRLLMEEWEALGRRCTTAPDRMIWEAVRGYILYCVEQPQTYLKFIGD